MGSPPKIRRAKTFLLFLFDPLTPQIQKRNLLKNISSVQLECLEEIAYNIYNNNQLPVDKKTSHALKKKKRVIRRLASNKVTDVEKVEMLQKKWLSVLRMLCLIENIIKPLLRKK